jgi:hypothetical protein
MLIHVGVSRQNTGNSEHFGRTETGIKAFEYCTTNGSETLGILRIKFPSGDHFQLFLSL